MITGLYRSLAKANDTAVPPSDFNKVTEMMREYEYDHLKSLSNLQWLLYPFLKTFQVLTKRCRRSEDPLAQYLKKQQ